MEALVANLRKTFNSQVTKSVEWRRKQLTTLERLVTENEQALIDAVQQDLHRPAVETIGFELNLIKNSINHALRNLNSYVQPRRLGMPALLAPAYSMHVQYEPLGVCLVIGAWNYPLQLNLVPLVGALASGNVAIVKPSEFTEHTNKLLESLFEKYWPSAEHTVALVNGAVETTTQLLAQKLDHIFYTGNTQVGKIIMTAAAKNLTPVCLECGGKSPVWVDESADLNITARRIAWGRFANAGQTCVAPDYVLCTQEVRDQLVPLIKTHVTEFYGENAKESDSYGRIINDRHFGRISGLIQNISGKVALGGETEASERYISPTVLIDISPEDKVMQEEIFGPVLPILAVKDYNEAIAFINARDKPLSLYVFSNQTSVVEAFRNQTSSGSMAVNEVLMQIAFECAPFGGVGASGLGAYHGEFSIETFSHRKPVMRTNFFGDSLSFFRYPPFDARKRQFAGYLATERKSNCNIL